MVKINKTFNVGDLVFVKVRGYPPWPAKIDNIANANTSNAKYHVVFYGTGEIGQCKTEDILKYAENKEKLIAKNGKRKNYLEGIEQLENDLQLMPRESIASVPTDISSPMAASSENQEDDNQVADNSVSNVANLPMDTTPSTIPSESDAETPSVDEGQKKKATKRKPPPTTPSDIDIIKKKKSRKSITATSPESTPKPDKSVDSPQQEIADAEDVENKKTVSRSGRKIKPKTFHGEEAQAGNVTKNGEVDENRENNSAETEDGSSTAILESDETRYLSTENLYRLLLLEQLKLCRKQNTYIDQQNKTYFKAN